MAVRIPLDASTEKIQEIIRNNNHVVFTKGTYDLTSTLFIYSNSKIDLNGARLRRFHSGALLRLYDSDSITEYNGTHDVEIYNGTLEGMNGKKYPYNPNTLLTMFHGMNITIHDVKFLDVCGCHAIDCVGCKNVTIKWCKFNGYASVGNDFRETIQIDYCYHSGVPSYKATAKCYDMTHCDNIMIDGCSFEKSKSYPAQYVAIGAHTQGDKNKSHNNITIQNCTAVGNGGKNGWLGYFVNIMNFKNVVIKNNIVSNYARFVLIDKPTKLYKSNDNTISPCGDNYINADSVYIIGNRIKSHKGTAQAWGILCEDYQTKNIIIKDNIGLDSSACSIK